MKKIKLFALIIAFVLLFSGCQRNNGISEMSIAQGVGIDSKGDKVTLYVQYLDLAKGTGTTDNLGVNITSVVSATGDNISYAVARVSSSVSGPVYFGQNRIIIFGKEYCKNGLLNTLDYVLRGVESRVDVNVAMSDDTAEKIINSNKDKAKVPAMSVYETVRAGEKNSLSIDVTTNDLLNISSCKTSDIYLPVLSVKDKRTFANGIAVFSKEKLALILDEKQSMAFVILKDKSKGGLISIRDEKFGTVGLEISDCKTKNKAYFENDKLCFSTNINIKLSLDDTEKGVATTVNEKDIKRLEKQVEKEIKNRCNQTVKLCFSKGCDPFFLDRNVAKINPKFYKENIDNWRELLKNVDYRVNVKSELSAINNSSTKG